MHALVYEGPGHRVWREVPDALVEEDTDAVVHVDAVTICGTDLHILKGDVPEVTPGRSSGTRPSAPSCRSGRGAAGEGRRPRARLLHHLVRDLRVCRASRYGQCQGGGGWILGHTINGVQAEYVRVPFADTSTYPVPAGVPDEEVLMLADILPTSYEVGCATARSCPATGDDRRRGPDRARGDRHRSAVLTRRS